jgi:hypothetical protein
VTEQNRDATEFEEKAAMKKQATQDGGPAFPVQYVPGMTLRDYFASAALTGLVANSIPTGAAKEAYEYADAMLKERAE